MKGELRHSNTATVEDDPEGMQPGGILGSLRKRFLRSSTVQLLAPGDASGVPASLGRWIAPCNSDRWTEAFNDYARFRWDCYRERGLLGGYLDTLVAGLYPYDRFSWIFLLRNAEGMVEACISARTFCIAPKLEQLAAGSLFKHFNAEDRRRCERSVRWFIRKTMDDCGLFCEISNWAILRGDTGTGAGALMALATGTLGIMAGMHRCLATANVDTKAYATLLRMSCRPLLDEKGRELLPVRHPFYRSRLGLLDGSSFEWHPRYGVNPESAEDFLNRCEVFSPRNHAE